MQKTFREVVEEQIPIKPLIIVILSIAAFAGYGLWTTANTGTLVIHSSLYGTRVFIDEHLSTTLNNPPDTLHLSEPAGKHSIIVSKDGYWPWTENIEIKKHETTELHPFIIPQKVSMESVPRPVFSNGVTSVDRNYTDTLALFENLNVSDEIKPLVEATRIQGVTYAEYFPGRTDVILVATKDGIFAVGVEKSDHPNFQPVYQGASPLFAKGKNGAIYIKDGDSIFRVTNLGI